MLYEAEVLDRMFLLKSMLGVTFCITLDRFVKLNIYSGSYDFADYPDDLIFKVGWEIP